MGELGAKLAVFIRIFRLRVIANVVSSSPILVTLIMEALTSSETSVLTRATRRNIPEDAILSSISSQHISVESYCYRCSSFADSFHSDDRDDTFL
jgi:hypothetical protein